MTSCAALLQIPALVIPIVVPPCAIGEVPIDDGYVCLGCTTQTFSLWLDTSASDADGDESSSNFIEADPTCKPCPQHAKCIGLGVIIPVDGYWHSAPHSPLMQRCGTIA